MVLYPRRKILKWWLGSKRGQQEKTIQEKMEEDIVMEYVRKQRLWSSRKCTVRIGGTRAIRIG